MKNIFRKFMAVCRSFRKLGRHPDFDWYFSLSLVAILFVVSLVSSGFLYYNLVIKDTPPVVTTVDSPLAFDKEELNKVIDNIRQYELNVRQVPSSVLADPF